MNIEELREAQQAERRMDSLQHLPDSFYDEVAEYVEERKSKRQEIAETAADPFSNPEVAQLTDEIETAEDVARAIYDRRVGKIVKLASFAASDMSADTDGLTVEERDAFEDIVGRMRDNRERVLSTLERQPAIHNSSGDQTDAVYTTNHSEDAEAIVEDSPDSNPKQESSIADDANPSGASSEDSSSDTGVDRTTVRITRDVGTIFGVDEREYELAADDIVTLPKANAEPLLSQDAAKKLD